MRTDRRLWADSGTMAIVGVLEGGYDDAHRERIRAHAKHADKPGGSMEMKSADDPDWFPVLCEEVGEVAREINDYRHGLISDDDRMPRLRAELVQVAAMAHAWIAAIDEWDQP